MRKAADADLRIPPSIPDSPAYSTLLPPAAYDDPIN